MPPVNAQRSSPLSHSKKPELFTKSKMDEAQNIEQKKDKTLSIWQSITTDDSTT
jgi:hypothetical protein